MKINAVIHVLKKPIASLLVLMVMLASIHADELLRINVVFNHYLVDNTREYKDISDFIYQHYVTEQFSSTDNDSGEDANLPYINNYTTHLSPFTFGNTLTLVTPGYLKLKLISLVCFRQLDNYTEIWIPPDRLN